MEPKQIKNLLATLEFTSQEGAKGVFRKEYPQFRNYAIVVDCDKKSIDYGDKIKCGSKRTQSFSQAENFVVLECVDRLLTKGYKPENIELEKIWPAGHGRSGELDICVYREGKDRKEYLLIECKTYGMEFDKALTKIEEDGGQLFTYFKFSNSADLLMLYASQLSGNKIVYRNEIVRIEEDYRSGDVRDFYEKWNKLTKDNGIFEDGRELYLYESRARSIAELDDINELNSEKLFYNFLKILRANAISDKPNAFNKVFNLFICKIYDEWHNENDGIAQFVWQEEDSPEKFMTRLTELYEKAIDRFLNKKVIGLRSLDDLNLSDVPKSFISEIKELLVRESNDFAILEIIDKNDFYKNTNVVKSIVQLFENLKIRYDKQNNYLSNFFEQLLNTGLKQEVGQFFTPIPITKFILKSIPLKDKFEELLKRGELPKIIDYAAGSGHFIHESMHAIQNLLDNYGNIKVQNPSTKEKIRTWKSEKYSWANDSIYGIERDYRLSKVAKVGCYMHGDGVANIINGNGLDDFYKSGDYIKVLKLGENDRNDNYKKFGTDNPVFDFVISNPPFAVDDFSWSLTNCKDSFAEGKHSFTLYDFIADKSKEIECLFIERAKQLLKDGGVAGIILPSSILSNGGIYAKAREMIFRYFEIIAITELGSGTFMATGTNTVVLFLRRRNNYDSINLERRVEKFFKDFLDVTMNGVETPVAEYLNYVWEGVKWDDYISLLKNEPSKSIQKHELYKEYEAKIKLTGEDFHNRVLATEKEKLFYFILAWPQQVVIVKSGDKEVEKSFLGYEFSNRRGNEGIHPIQRGKTIDECTQLFDADTLTFENPEKASTYIYRAFTNPDAEWKVSENLKNHVFKMDMVDMMTFDWATVETKISLAIKKKVKIKSKWQLSKIDNVLTLEYGKGLSEKNRTHGQYPVLGSNGIVGYHNEYLIEGPAIIVGRKGSVGKVTVIDENCYPIDTTFYVKIKENNLSFGFCRVMFEQLEPDLETLNVGLGPGGLNRNDVYRHNIPLPPPNIQAQIVKDIEKIEQEEKDVKDKITVITKGVYSLIENYPLGRVGDICTVSTEKENPQDSPDREYLYLGLEHIESHTGVVSKNTDWGRNILSQKNVFHSGDVLYGKLRPYLNKVAVMDSDGVCSTDILVLKTAVPKYLKYALLSENFVKQTSELMKGVSLPRIGVEDFLNQKIPLPSPSEQKKIVTKIEKLENEISDLQKELESFPERKNAVLQKWL